MSNFPEAPRGVPAEPWQKSQLALRAAGVPRDIVSRLKTLRQMNLYTWLVIVMKHPWKFVADNEGELLKKQINKNDVRYQGKKAT